jgi:PAS domain S-box-containing protein
VSRPEVEGDGSERTAQALRASEERLRVAQAAGGVGTFEYVREGERMLVSPEFCRIWGVDVVEEAPIGFFLALIHPDDHARVVATHVGDRAEKAFDPIEYRIVRPDTGETRWLARRGEPVRDPATGAMRWYGVVFDISDRKAAEEALKEREGLLSAFIDQATAGFAQVDLSGRFTLVNDRFCEIAGRSREELLTLTMIEITHPDDIPANVGKFERAVAEGTPYAHEKRYVRPDGSIVWVNNSVSVIRRPSGEPYGILAVTIDVTERRIAEAAVRESEARLRALADNLPGGMVYQLSTHPSGERRFLFISQGCEKLTGYPAEAIMADASISYAIVVPEDYAALAAASAEAIRTGTQFDLQCRFRRADGELRWARVISAPREGPEGSTIWDGIQIDVTDQKHAEEMLRDLNETLEQRVAERAEELAVAQEALRQAQKMEAMGQLTGGVAHDFNNLLTPIIGSLDLLHRKALGGERERRLVEGALQSAERAKTLVQRLLAFARRQPLQPGPVDLPGLVGGMVELIASTSGPQIRIETRLDPALPFARADSNQLEMAILNLAVNARDAMAGGGILTVGATAETVAPGEVAGLAAGDYVRLTVADTGVGMDEATLARAVEPFFSTKGVGRGTGLGLSMVHGLAAQLGGALTLDSRVGEGTVAALWLPVSDSAPASAEVRRRPDSAPGATAGTVLLVDDEPLVRASTADMLAEMGYEVIEADSGSDALALVDVRVPDLVITDHLMPGISGTDLALILAAERPGLPVLIVSGYADLDGLPPDLPRLTKPFRQADLADCVARLRGRDSH